MRRIASLTWAGAAVLLFIGSLVAQNNYQFSDPNVEDLFRYARMAAGGGLVSKLKTLELKGRSRVDMGGSLLECTVDIKILLPDHYLRVDTTWEDAKLAGYAGKGVLNASAGVTSSADRCRIRPMTATDVRPGTVGLLKS